MKPNTQIRIGLIPMIAFIAFDVYLLFFTSCSRNILIGMSIVTLIFVVFGFALIARNSKMAWWVYYHWWTVILLPLLFALIDAVYLIANKNFLMLTYTLLLCGIFVGLPVIFFRIGLIGLERISKIENGINESSEDDQKQ